MRLDCLRNMAEKMLKKYLTKVILRTGGTASGYFRVYHGWPAS